MKAKEWKSVGLTVALLGAITCTYADTEENKPAAKQKKGPKHGARMELPKAKELLKKYDKDEDGKLSKNELERLRRDRNKMINKKRKERPVPPQFLEKFDTDGDGTLSAEEREQARVAHQNKKHKAEKKNIKEGETPDKVKKPEPQNKKRRQEMFKHMIERFDTDGDGVLSEEEKAAMPNKKEMFQKKRKKIMEKFDADGDGQLNEEERNIMRETLKQNVADKRAQSEQ